jgi:hypothetical protein
MGMAYVTGRGGSRAPFLCLLRRAFGPPAVAMCGDRGRDWLHRRCRVAGDRRRGLVPDALKPRSTRRSIVFGQSNIGPLISRLRPAVRGSPLLQHDLVSRVRRRLVTATARLCGRPTCGPVLAERTYRAPISSSNSRLPEAAQSASRRVLRRCD